MSELEKSEECYGCHFETAELTYYRSVFGKMEGKWLCDLCASTFSGNAVDHPTHYDGPTLATICYVGNVILAETHDSARRARQIIEQRVATMTDEQVAALVGDIGRVWLGVSTAPDVRAALLRSLTEQT